MDKIRSIFTIIIILFFITVGGLYLTGKPAPCANGCLSEGKACTSDMSCHGKACTCLKSSRQLYGKCVSTSPW